MESLVEQRRLISQVLSECAEYISKDPSVEPALVMDEERSHYLLLFLDCMALNVNCLCTSMCD